MTDVPEDIKLTAEKIFDELRYETFSDNQEDLVHDLDVIARAILAERERCAKAAFDHLDAITPILAEQARDAILHDDPYYSDPTIPPKPTPPDRN